ncbi:MAG: sigma-54-dependent Fis family transcriptional regulator [Blastocatellia bacterium]|nr:sigma-54-dependent Fis family transcriptional regulator [Blastocatellia bacterium]
MVNSTEPQALIFGTETAQGEQMQQILQQTGWAVTLRDLTPAPVPPMNLPHKVLIVVIENSGCETSLALLTQCQGEIAQGTAALVVFAAQPASADAMQCLQQGAADYRGWPLLPSEIQAIAAQVRRQFASAIPLTEISRVPSITGESKTKTLIGGSRPMLELSRQLVKVAQVPDLPVFLNGETGTGKEVVAWQIHQLSRRPGAFRAINCAAMVESLLESELFGHEKGAFTGAHATRKGLWEEAANGTIFLDEITEATPAMQAKLLRVLQESTIRRVGSNHEIQVTARIIAASNRNLSLAVKEKLFREDLYYRLGQVIAIPPLRERAEDIPLLVAHFTERMGQGTIFTPEAIQLLCRHYWPGNVRELESVVHKLVAYAGKYIYAEDVERYLMPQEITAHQVTNELLFGLLHRQPSAAWPTAQELRERYVMEAWLRWGQASQVARVLGIDYRTVHQILRKLNLAPSDDSSEPPPAPTDPGASA